MHRLHPISCYFYTLILVLVFCTGLAQLSHAQNAESAKRLDDIKSQIDTVNQDKKKLSLQKKTLEKNIEKQQGSLVTLSTKIQNNELNQKHLRTQLLELTEKEKVLDTSFKARKIDVERLIFAMIRLKTVPTEIMLLQPDGLLKAAQGSMVMGGVLPNVEQDLINLAEEIQSLTALKEEIKHQKEKAEQVKRELAADHKKLASLMAQRKTDLYNTNKNLHRHQLTLSKLSSEAKDVEDLLNKIARLQNIPKPVSAPRKSSNASQQSKAAETKPSRSTAKLNRHYAKVKPPQGLAPGMPVVGNVNVKYGQTDDIGAKSQGWTISTQENAIVTAPFAGTIKYTGAFKRYGQIILIEHDENYFSLIGGIEEIFVLPETKIRQGAPIAKMGEITKSSGEIGLYYEVRYKGKPVDPKRLLSSRKL